MRAGPTGYAPVRGHLVERLAENPALHDPEVAVHAATFVLPSGRRGPRIVYDLVEHDPLLDSSNVGLDEWRAMALDIEAHYDDYDAFVLVHGTDTMAYTASALSFALDNLGKTVILTGSQVPLVKPLSDGRENLLGALTLAGHYDLPEVGVFFHHRLLRGNRARKVDASGLGAFESGNFPALAKIGSTVEVRWDLVRSPPAAPLRVQPLTHRHVAALRLFPGLDAQTLAAILKPPLLGLVLEAYGTGNGPDRDAPLLEVIANATRAGIVVVAVTQCHHGTVTGDYAAGTALLGAGVTPGRDLSPEAALTKLVYLLSCGFSPDEVRARIGQNLRGELTPTAPSDAHSFRDQAFFAKLSRIVGEWGATRDPSTIRAAVVPSLVVAAAGLGDVVTLRRMLDAGADPDSASPDGRTAIMAALGAGHPDVVAELRARGAKG
jgi:lysophospholipase